MKNLYYKNKIKVQQLLLLFFVILITENAWGQQVIGSFPTTDGGFEGQTAGTSGTSLSPTAWSTTTSTTIIKTINATGGRSGPKYFTIGQAATTSTTTARWQSPNITPTLSTAYMIQYYYRSAADAAGQQVAVYTNGTSNSGLSSGAIIPNTSNVWTKYSVTVTSNAAVVATAGFAGIRALGTANTPAFTYDVDDFVCYPGSVADATAPDPATALAFGTPSATQIPMSWNAPGTGVDGGGYMVIRYTANPSTTNQPDPNANGIYAVGNTIGTGTVVYLGTTAGYTDLGLTPSTPYWYRTYTVDKAFNYSSNIAGTASTGAASFAAAPTAQVTGLNFTSISQTGFTLNWTAAASGGGTNHLIVVKASAAISADPSVGSSYTSDAAFVNGSAIGGGEVVYNGTGNSIVVTGLSRAITYYVRIYDFNGSGGSENYFTTSPTSGTQMTPPGVVTSNGSSPSSGTIKSFSDGTAWTGGIAPTQYDNAIITLNDYLNVGSSQKCYNLNVNAGSKISASSAQTLQVYGTSLVCDGILGDPSLTTSILTTEFGGNLTISGAGSIYPYKIRPVTGLSNIGVTFAANTTITYTSASIFSDNTGNDNISFTVNNGVIVNMAGNMNTTNSSSTNGNANTTWNINGIVNCAGSFSPIVALAKTFTANVNGTGSLTVLNIKTPPIGGAVANINVASGGTLTTTVLGNADFSGRTPAIVSGGGSFILASGATITVGAPLGLQPSTGPIRTTTRNFNTAANYAFSDTLAAQVTGSDMPATINSLAINNAFGVTLSNPVTAQNVILTLGTLANSSNNITLPVSGIVTRTAGILSAAPVYGAGVSVTYNGAGATSSFELTPLSGTIDTIKVNATGDYTLNTPITAANLILTSKNIVTTATNLLTLKETAIIIGGSTTSFVSGPMKKLTNSVTSFSFPVGKGVSYRPASVIPLNTTSSSYTAEYFNAAQGTTTVTSPLQVMGTSEYWDITKNLGSNASVSLNYDKTATTTWSGATPDNSKYITVAHLVGGSWIDETGSTGTTISGSATTGTVTSQVLTTFSPFTFGSKSTTALPVNLIEFRASKVTFGNQLSWKVSNELSLSKYEIQRSVDGRSFTSIGFVNAVNSSIDKTYSFTDGNAINGVNFYLLKMINLDGSFKYSAIVKVDMNGKKGINIYPNPVTDNVMSIQMNGQPKGDYAITIYSTNGKVMEQKLFNHNGTDGTRAFAIKNNVPIGSYLIVVKNGNTTIGSYPLVIQ